MHIGILPKLQIIQCAIEADSMQTRLMMSIEWLTEMILIANQLVNIALCSRHEGSD